MSTAQGYASNADGDYRSGQQFVDPSTPDPNSYASWKGGCGRDPLSATASKGSNPERTGKTCADGTTGCAGHPWGSWGYEKNGGFGYSHHYAKRSELTTVCVNFYDVHGGGKFNSGKFQLVNGASEITVNANSDNSIQTNSFNTAQGANCFTFNATPSATTTQQSVVPNDTATVTGNSPTGTVKFDLFGPGDSSCSGSPAFSQTRTLGGGQASTDNSGAGAFVASSPGTWRWKLTYSGDVRNPPKTGGCRTESFTVANNS
jgi:hypothetical protein